MPSRIPLVLNGIIISELQPGDSLSAVSKNVPVISRQGTIIPVTLDNSSYAPILKRDGSEATVILEV